MHACNHCDLYTMNDSFIPLPEEMLTRSNPSSVSSTVSERPSTKDDPLLAPPLSPPTEAPLDGAVADSSFLESSLFSLTRFCSSLREFSFTFALRSSSSPAVHVYIICNLMFPPSNTK